LYAGISLDGKVIVTRNRVNERFYGREISGLQILSGEIPSPPAARPLYDALQRCHVYATGNNPSMSRMLNRPKTHVMRGYPEPMYPTMMQQEQTFNLYQRHQQHPQSNHPLDEHDGLMPPASNDNHSYADMSDITSNPGY
jgi:hypothetical protein